MGNHKVYNNAQKEDTDSYFIGNLNPFRYRSYYYDTETKLYFLKTRYYDPEVGRFINMDSIEYADPQTINGLNLYAYCGNNPVMNEDPEGRAFWDSVFKISLAVVAIAAVATLAVATAGTAVGIIAAGAAIGGAAGFVSGGITGAIGAAATGQDVYDGFANGALFGTVLGGISGALNAMAPGVGGSMAAVIANAGSIALTAGKVAAGVIGAAYVLARTQKLGGYYGQKYSNDHDPEHVHLKGTDGTDIRIGRDGKPLPGEPTLKPQVKKALERLLDQILELFG